MPNGSKESASVVRAGIYTRISWDPAGQRAGVQRQRRDCEALCASRHWKIAQYFEDNDSVCLRRQAPSRLRTDGGGGRGR